MTKATSSSLSKTDLNKENVKKAITEGKKLLKSGKTKAETSREIFPLVQDESREVICQVFQKGVNLTEKGAMTYYYNCRRNSGK